MVKKYKEQLIVQKSLFYFFVNWNTSNIVEQMCDEDSGFKHAWEQLYEKTKIRHKKQGGMWIVEDLEIYELFAKKLTFKAQALLMDKTLKEYKEQVTKNIEFSIELNEKIKTIKNN